MELLTTGSFSGVQRPSGGLLAGDAFEPTKHIPKPPSCSSFSKVLAAPSRFRVRCGVLEHLEVPGVAPEPAA